MLVREGKVSLFCFVATAGLILILAVPQFFFEYVPHLWGAPFWGPIFYYALFNMVLKLVLRSSQYYEVAVRASFLGFIFALGGVLVTYGPTNLKSFGLYIIVLSIFHWSEYMAIAYCNPRTLSTDSFILNHSVHYVVAAVASWIEFFIETHFFPQMKIFPLPWIVGIMVCLAGEVLRKLAMVTASTSFTHLVQFEHVSEHQLVRWGIFSVMRHPSYVGWFWWSIGTQIILANPICILLYTAASWMFFKDRVFIEEYTLINFFGEEYIEYKRTVPSGLPFIDGYKVEK